MALIFGTLSAKTQEVPTFPVLLRVKHVLTLVTLDTLAMTVQRQNYLLEQSLHSRTIRG